MRVIQVLYRQHIDRMFKKHWRVQGQRIPIDTGVETHLKSLGISVYDPQEIVREPRKKIKIDVVGFAPKPVAQDSTHPDWHDQVCYFHRDNNVLLLGIDQAKKITKTVEIQNGLPDKFETVPPPSPEQNKTVQSIVKSSHLFDAEQQKLPKIKDPERPAWNFPRVLGITYSRVCKLTMSRLLQLCEMSSDKSVANEKMLLNNVQFTVPLKREEDNLLLEMTADQLLLAKKPLPSFTKDTADNIELTSLDPIHHTVTLTPENIYQFKDICPLKRISTYHPHTVFVYFDKTKVQNLYEEEVTETQILGRSLMKTFAVAASYARAKFGNDVKLLPEPVSLQCIHTDGKIFHFGVLQLNTLGLNDDGVKNIWYSIPRMPLFSLCEYKVGIPTLEGYNPDILKHMLAFYNSK